MDGGDLQNLIYKSSNRLSTSLVRQYMAELVYAINELHKLNIIHRDLKPANIFIDKKGRLVIGDFGLSRSFGKDDTDFDFERTTSSTRKTYKMCGTPGYMAPEVYLQTGYSYSVDTFALGSIFFEMLFRRYAFTGRDANEVHEHVLHGTPHFVRESRVDEDTIDLLYSVCHFSYNFVTRLVNKGCCRCWRRTRRSESTWRRRCDIHTSTACKSQRSG